MSFVTLRDLLRMRLKRDEQFEPWRDISMGKVVAVNGSINAGPAHLWVNLWGDEGSPTTVYNDAVTVVAGDWVKIGKSPKDPFRWSVIGYWAGDIEPEYLARVARHEIGTHGTSHQIPTESTAGADPVNIYQPALQPFKTTGNGTNLTITINPLEYNVGGPAGAHRTFNGTTVDLTSSVPSTSGEVRAVQIYLDTTTNQIGTRDGTAVPDTGPYPIQYPTGFANERTSAYVILSNGQTAISTASDIIDARDFLAGDTDFLPEPDSEGQVLVTDETENWIAASPMISEDDAWMVGDDDLLVIL